MLNYPCVPQDDYSTLGDATALAVFVFMAVFCYFEYTSYNESPINQEITQCYTTTCQASLTTATTSISHHQPKSLLAAKC